MTAPWLLASAEVPCPKANHDITREEFVAQHNAALRSIGFGRWHREQLIGVAAVESAWGHSKCAAVNNFAGLKAKKDVAAKVKKILGTELQWFRQAGHVAQGDSPEVTYAVFPSPKAFWEIWVKRHVGYGHTPPWASIYFQASELFWLCDESWCAALLRAGYSEHSGEAGVQRAARSRLDCARTARGILDSLGVL